MKHLSLRLSLLLLFAAVALSAVAKVWSADDIPMIHLQDSTRYVCDPENIIPTASRDSADALLYKLHHECGIQTVFIVVPNVKNADCFRMAQDVGNHYGVGTKAERRGLVIVLATKDRRYFIAPGKGLEGDLTDVECNDIGQACIVKNMKVNNTDKALLSTCSALYSKFKTGKTGIKKVDEGEEEDPWAALVLFTIVAFFFFFPGWSFIESIFELLGLKKPTKKHSRRGRWSGFYGIPPSMFDRGDDDFGGFGGGSFGGGSFGGGGAGGGW
jgi:uncharacterized protein